MNSLGRYQLLGHLAKVGADEVFLAQTSDASGYDFHTIRRIRTSSVEEARRAAWLRHPNLVSIRELGSDDHSWYVAAEYIHGEDLGRVLARVRRTDEQVPIALVTAIGAAAAAGLHHAHTHAGSRRTRRGSVHGAVSPPSIVIGYDGSVKVAGLGAGTATDASYLAPEQATELPGELDARTDVFALGIVLYELATSRRLFRAPNDFLTKAAIAAPNIPAPSRFRRGLPRALENIILKALAPAPEERFKSAGELRAALEGFARRVGMQQSPAGIADYLRTLFGQPPQPRVSEERTSAERLDSIDDGQLGVAAPPEAVLRELGVPEARELEATPGRGTRTPMSWTSQSAPPAPARPVTWRRTALMAAAAVVSGLIAFGVVGAVRGGGELEVVPGAAPPPPPPPLQPARLMIAPLPAAAEPPATPELPAPPGASPGTESATLTPAPVTMTTPAPAPMTTPAPAATPAPATTAPAPATTPATVPAAKPRPAATRPTSRRERPERRLSMAAPMGRWAGRHAGTAARAG